MNDQSQGMNEENPAPAGVADDERHPKQDNVTKLPQRAPLTATGGRPLAIIPRTFDEAYRIGKAAVVAKWAPYGWTDEQATMAICHGAEIGLPPMMALQKICIINGRPCVWGDAVPAIALATGQLEDWEETLNGEGDEMTAVCRVKRRSLKTPIIRMFSVADARQAGLWDEQPTVSRYVYDKKLKQKVWRDNVPNDSPWFRYRKRMLQMRARVAFRDGFADAFSGLYIAEEMMGDAEMRDVTPREFKRVANPMSDDPPANNATGTRYWHHQESGQLWTSVAGDPDQNGQSIEEVIEDRYNELLREQQTRDQQTLESSTAFSTVIRATGRVQTQSQTRASEQPNTIEWSEPQDPTNFKTAPQKQHERAKSVASKTQAAEAPTEPAGEPKATEATQEPTPAKNEPAAVLERLAAEADAKQPETFPLEVVDAHGFKPGITNNDPPAKSISERATAARGMPGQPTTAEAKATAAETKMATGGFYQDALAIVANSTDATKLNQWWRQTRKARIDAGMSASDLDNLTQTYSRKFLELSGS